MSSLSSASVVDLERILVSFLVEFDQCVAILGKVFGYLAGLVVCANDGLDVDLLVSSSLDGWEEESDLCVMCVNPAKTKTKTNTDS